MHLVRETYQRLFNKTPNIQIIHAGLECGLFKKPYPEMDAGFYFTITILALSPVHISNERQTTKGVKTTSVLDTAD